MFEIIGTIFNVLLYQPMLNILVLFYIYLHSFGWSVIIFTILVKLALYPLNTKSLESQKVMQEIQPKLKEIQEKYKDDKDRQAQEMINLYREKKFNPFSGFFVLFLQLPIIIALFRVFQVGATQDVSAMIYPFVPNPGDINFLFFGLDLAVPSMVLAGITAVMQFFQVKTMNVKKKKEEKKSDDPAERMSQMMQKQMLIILPIFTFFVLTRLPAALGLYWIVVTIFSIVQQKLILKNT